MSKTDNRELKAWIEAACREFGTRNDEWFVLEQPKAKKSKAKFHDNRCSDGKELTQMVLFSGSKKCLAGQNDLSLWGE
jgi:hypothetical protein